MCEEDLCDGFGRNRFDVEKRKKERKTKQKNDCFQISSKSKMAIFRM